MRYFSERQSFRQYSLRITKKDFAESTKQNQNYLAINNPRQWVRRCADHCQWLKIGQIKTTDVEGFLFDLRDQHHLSIRTSNHYLKAIKQFCRWLVLNQRMKHNPVERITTLNAKTDRRHDRRALSMDELLLLIHAAETGPPAVGLTGPDRAMLYLLAAWTGFRRGELGSLTLRSFHGLDTDSPTIKVEAAYSKHRRDDVQLLHPEITERFKKWVSLCLLCQHRQARS